MRFFALLSSALAAVVELTTGEFDDFLKDNSGGALVAFTAPWCGHCKRLHPEFEAASEVLGDKVKLANIDATKETELASKFGVRGYPTIKWFVNGQDSEYDGGRTKDTIVDWVKQMTGPAVEEVEEIPAAGSKPVVALTGDASEGFADAAKGLRKKAQFVHKKGGAAKVTLQHKGEPVIELEGAIDKAAVEKLVNANLMPKFGQLDGETFSQYMESGKGLIWILFDMGSESDIEPIADKSRAEMMKLASAVSDKYSVTYTDTKKFKDALENMLGVSEFPRVAVQQKAGDKKKFIYEGAMEASKIEQFVKDVDAGKIEAKLKSEDIPSDNSEPVKVIVGKNLKEEVFTADKDVLLEIYAPWCGHCKKLEPEYEKVAKKIRKEGLEDLLTIAKMDGTQNDSPVSEIDWSGFPTLYYVKAGSSTPQKYDGGRTAKDIWRWIKQNSSHADTIKERTAKNKAEKSEEL
jgi:protein disulfide-isomerase/protein disulfide-isomerase A1